jgi:transcriptional regulator with XRE-family HTH domain
MPQSTHSPRYIKLLSILADARKTAGISQAVLAERLDCLQTFVSKYERGERRLDIIEFLDVTQALNLDPCKVIRQLERSSG